MNDQTPPEQGDSPPKDRPVLPLGPFELHARFARGGMGEVWRGIHKEQGVPVAVKVITAARARREDTLIAFRNEIRAIAGLDHPGIVMVFDHGTIPQETEALSHGALVRGSPYLVMELASRGSLARLRSPLRWNDLRLVILSLLQALGHAHARGVIHRDLKPGNVLMAGDDDIRPGLKLTDFGIAHVIDSNTRADSRELTMGTPTYMSPEQLRGLWRDYGPWTDLYALGCMIYKIAAGHYPFQSKRFAELCRMHLEAPPPPFETPNPMPKGLEAWVHTLLEKDPRRRFQRAADAAQALEALGQGTGPRRRPPANTMELSTQAVAALEEDEPTLAEMAAATVMIWEQAVAENDPSRPDVAHAVDSDALPLIPERWQRNESPPNVRLLGAGLGLYGLRTIPMVDRDAERDQLWQTLRDVRDTGQARAVLLTGPAGVGKSRLVEWICQRAHEMGAAAVLTGSHSPIAGGDFGLPGMLAHHTRCLGLRHHHARERMERLLREQGVEDPYEWLAMTELMVPATDADAVQTDVHVQFRSSQEQFFVIQRHLERLARERTVIVWLDDVQWGVDSLEYLIWAMKQQQIHAAPILYVLTARDEALVEQELAWRALGELLELPGASRMAVEPLEAGALERLVQDLLVLQGDLASQVESRSGGNPLFAIQLIGDWVQRGVLEVGTTGFRLKDGERAVLPDNLYDVWNARLGRMLEGHTADARQALEVAALIGQNVRTEEWRQACSLAGLELPLGLLDRLLAQRLARPVVDGWSFVHNMLRETLARSAQEHGRWPDLHAACADMLTLLHPHGGRGVAERRARHLLGAGLKIPAIDALLEATSERIAQQDVRVAQSLLAERETTLRALNIPESDVRWGQGWVANARGLLYQDKHLEAHVQARKAEASARQHQWTLFPETLRVLGDISRRRGAFEEAADFYREALGPFEAQNNYTRLANALHGLAEVVFRRGEVASASDLTDKALKLFRQQQDDGGVAMCQNMLGQIAQNRGDMDRCEDYFRQALSIYNRIGHRFGVANAYNVLAEVARHRGNLEDAERGYRKAHEMFNSVGASGLIPRLNLGLVLVARGQLREARTSLEETQDILEARGAGAFLLYTHTALLACAPANHDWHAWDTHMKAIRTLLEQHTLLDPDIAWCAQLAGDNAANAGERVNAGEAYELALEQWKGLGDNDKVAEVSAAWASVAV